MKEERKNEKRKRRKEKERVGGQVNKIGAM